jgi:predicted adenylyl cyclase CyaB
MEAMIEVEIRGRLDESRYKELKKELARRGHFIKHTDREMYLLYDYPGYDPDPMKRMVDIRIRNTNGECEIMMKEKMSANNEARKETSLRLKDHDLERAKAVMKGLGCKKALRMQRSTDIYEYDGAEWSAVKTPKNYFYYEAEGAAADKSNVSKVHGELILKAKSFGLEVLGPEKMKEFIYLLDREVNEEVEL